MTTTPPASAPRLLLPSVARRLAGHRIDDLRGQAAKIEQGLSRGPIGASGVQDPYLVQVHRQAREQLQAVQEEIERLSQMDDNEVREWAANERPRRARGF